MLRWGRWAVVHVGVLSGSGSKIVSSGWSRPFSLSAITPHSSKTTKDNTPLTTLRKHLADNRPVESAYEACRNDLSYLSKSEFSKLLVGARPEFIVRVCADQMALGRRIPDSDRYRYMLAHLACCLSALEHSTRSGGNDSAPIEHLTQAHDHYTKLAKNQMGAVHQVYLEHLLRIYLSARGPQTQVVGGRISNVLKSLLAKPRSRFESRLSQVVWRIVASVQFDASQKKSILHLLRLRRSPNTNSPVQVLDPLEALRRAILDSPGADVGVNQEARSILYDAQAWEWLRALAGATSPIPEGNTRLNVLALLRQLEHADPSPDSLERAWGVWMTILGLEATSAHTTPAIDRAILVAFLRLAAQFQSVRVVSGSERLLTVFTSVVYEADQIHMAQPGSLSVQLGAAYACTGTSNVFGLAARLYSAGFRADRLPIGYLTRLVELLLEYSPRVAWEVASQIRAELPFTLVASVAHDCAKAGYITGAVSMLRDTRLGEERHRIALLCLRQLDRQRGVFTRADAVAVCDALGPDLSLTPRDLQHTAVRMALNAGLVHSAGLMGSQWKLRPSLQRLLAARLVKARLVKLAPKVIDPRQTRWLSMLDNADYRQKSTARTRPSRLRAYGKINATRLGNKQLVRSGAHLGGRARLRATLATLARLLRARGPAWSKRASFRPDGVTLNIIVRALVRSTFCVSSSDLRALFDLLSRAGRCGMDVAGNHFGTEANLVLGGYASSALALARLVPRIEGPWAFVRYVRPLLRTFISGLRVRGDQEAVKVVAGILRAEDAHWRRTGWHRPVVPIHN